MTAETDIDACENTEGCDFISWNKPAKGTAGELKLYDTDPKDAAMIMAIVADATGKPLNELRFLSIREIKEEEKK